MLLERAERLKQNTFLKIARHPQEAFSEMREIAQSILEVICMDESDVKTVLTAAGREANVSVAAVQTSQVWKKRTRRSRRMTAAAWGKEMFALHVATPMAEVARVVKESIQEYGVLQKPRHIQTAQRTCISLSRTKSSMEISLLVASSRLEADRRYVSVTSSQEGEGDEGNKRQRSAKTPKEVLGTEVLSPSQSERGSVCHSKYPSVKKKENVKKGDDRAPMQVPNPVKKIDCSPQAGKAVSSSELGLFGDGTPRFVDAWGPMVYIGGMWREDTKRLNEMVERELEREKLAYQEREGRAERARVQRQRKKERRKKCLQVLECEWREADARRMLKTD
uniref:Uncharacterized protein n=1 Tax=Chromera velia CCMP2878 TaxID=1169474 RepID=A0A0G4GHM1_9ALVE|eukprot:Cvel_21929.t1-p1 / transcript=Cvel_21929.t1 / gene=Cvel_21929 / organism=Chromera_velia_CCMP2878 / gene_product=hypothetical protein / transcript_product=hypothetical protein / location=Cvel_scaffold2103:17298-18302(-) / protein_length=335 / sequence_SO=supercontig / SO=protein_coding / is_pseudo=false